VMHAKRRHLDEEIPFPRKKLRNTLTHYSLGRVSKQLLRALPPLDTLRAKAGGCMRASKLSTDVGYPTPPPRISVSLHTQG
jgi:hypothetical protein